MNQAKSFNYSVLMSVYYKEKPEFLDLSVNSVMNQTVKPNDFVLVLDGPLTDELYDEINKLKTKYGCLQTVELKENVGLGKALSYGIAFTKNNIIMRMDSDDICLPNRAEIQLPFLEKYDLVGGYITEFDDDPQNLIGVRKTPEHYKDIVKFAKKRNPFNHPSVMYKKSAIIEAGNYMDLKLMEDYYLWLRFLQINHNVYNIQRPLVNMRSGVKMRVRRGTKTAKRSIKYLRKYMYQIKFIGLFSYLFGTFAQLLVLSLPLFLRSFIYKRLLRK